MSNPETCQKYSECMSAFIDDELAGSELTELQEHLSNCPSCAEELSELEKVKNALASLPKAQMKRELDFSFLETNSSASDCGSFTELLDAYHDNELAAGERSDVEKHLSACNPCSQKLSDIAAVSSRLKSLPKIEPSRDIVGEMQFENKQKNNVLPFRKHRIAIATAAAAAVAIVFAINFKPANQPTVAVKPQTAPTLTAQQAMQTTAPAKQPSNETEQASATAPEIASNTGTEEATTVGLAAPEPEQKQPTAQKQVPETQVADLTKPKADDSKEQNEIALMPEITATGADALGIATDEDGLYDIKI